MRGLTGSDGRSRPTSASVVLAVRDGMPELTDQLEALAAQVVDVPWELVVADNGSSDGTRAEVARFEGRFPHLVVVDASARPGQQYGRRSGARGSQGELLAFCDHDDVVAPGWLQALVDAAPDFDALGGALEVRSLNTPQAVATRPEVEGHEVGLPRVFNGVTYAIGANWAIWRDVYDEIDDPDGDLPPGVIGEDVETGCRLARADRSLGFAARARVAYRLRQNGPATRRQMRSYGRCGPVLAARYPDLGGQEPSLARTLWVCARLVARATKARLEGDELHWSRISLAYELGRLESELRVRLFGWGLPR